MQSRHRDFYNLLSRRLLTDGAPKSAFWKMLPYLFGASIIALGFVLRQSHFDIRAWGKAGYVFVFLATLAGSATIIYPAPNVPILLAGAVNLHPGLVALCGGLGWGLGEITGYYLGRFASLPLKEKLSSQRTFRSARTFTERRGLLGVFLLALIPNPIFDLVGIAAGILGVPVAGFLLSCVAGRLTAALVICLSASYGARSL